MWQLGRLYRVRIGLLMFLTIVSPLTRLYVTVRKVVVKVKKLSAKAKMDCLLPVIWRRFRIRDIEVFNY